MKEVTLRGPNVRSPETKGERSGVEEDRSWVEESDDVKKVRQSSNKLN